jgi:hypothetical protein
MSFCVSETNLKTPHSHLRLPSPRHGDVMSAIQQARRLGKGFCDVDTTTDAATATKSVSIDCAWSSGSKSHIEGVTQFHGDTLDGTTTTRFSSPNHPTTERSSTVKGRYIGPCDPK